ncbi:hypothetical protein ACJX0J_019991, partial [Zea mays]
VVICAFGQFGLYKLVSDMDITKYLHNPYLINLREQVDQTDLFSSTLLAHLFNREFHITNTPGNFLITEILTIILQCHNAWQNLYREITLRGTWVFVIGSWFDML